MYGSMSARKRDFLTCSRAVHCGSRPRRRTHVTRCQQLWPWRLRVWSGAPATAVGSNQRPRHQAPTVARASAQHHTARSVAGKDSVGRGAGGGKNDVAVHHARLQVSVAAKRPVWPTRAGAGWDVLSLPTVANRWLAVGGRALACQTRCLFPAGGRRGVTKW